jgi:uncharacterized protein (TIGR00159 family)
LAAAVSGFILILIGDQMSGLKNILINFRIADLLDILVIALFLYYLFLWIQKRASRSIIIVISSVILLYAMARIFNMYMTAQVFQTGLTAALVALVIIYQEDIRMAFERMTTLGLFQAKHSLLASNKTVDCLIESICNLARDRIGALIVLKGRESLDRHLTGGISVNGRISVPLLYSIFHPETPSHDGAVIIEGERIEKFAVRLPLSHNLVEIGERGTRHTAAVGLAERSDALIVVVSEERGTVCIAETGKLTKVDRDTLRLSLDNFYKNIFPPPIKQTRFQHFSSNNGIKVFAILVSVILWSLFAYRVDVITRAFTLPIEYRNTPTNWKIQDLKPSEVQISLSGPERAFNFNPSDLVVSFDLSEIKEGYQTSTITKSNINLPASLILNHITPKSLSFKAMKTQALSLPVKVKTSGILKNGFRLNEIKCQPEFISVIAPVSNRQILIEIATEPLSIENLTESGSQKVKLIIPSWVQLANNQTGEVRVNYTISKH